MKKMIDVRSRLPAPLQSVLSSERPEQPPTPPRAGEKEHAPRAQPEDPIEEAVPTAGVLPAHGDQAGATVIEQIRALGLLRDEGLLTDEEFDRKKADLLDRL